VAAEWEWAIALGDFTVSKHQAHGDLDRHRNSGHVLGETPEEWRDVIRVSERPF